MTIKELHSIFLKYPIVSTDTRNIIPGSLFFALKGENFDANSFVKDALCKGAAYVIMDNKNFWEDKEEYILVDSVLDTLQKLATFHRKYLGIPIVALTGSNGKTTTKELINTVLSKRYHTIATTGNLNNHIGVPLTLLDFSKDTEIGIVEMGANHSGEINFLCNITQPNFGYITNFGKAHLEGFGSLEGVVNAKTELYRFLADQKGIVFVNSEDTIQMERSYRQTRILLEQGEIKDENSEFIKVHFHETIIDTNLVGNYNLPNISAAYGIGKYFNVPESDIKTAIKNYYPDNKRSQLIQKKNFKIILDAYNANPSSMQAALDNFSKNGTDKKIVILGDMFELGSFSEVEHDKIASLTKELSFNDVHLIGERFSLAKTKAVKKYKNIDDFKNHFVKSNFENNTILIKGSRGMALECLLELFE